MGHNASLPKKKSITKRFPARVISILNADREKGKKLGDKKLNEELPLYNNERIFKAKKHDPL